MNESLLRYHSGVSAPMKRELEAAPSRRFLALEFDHSSDEVFFINYQTDLYAPNHVVTLRTEVDGWGRDIHGMYKDGRWTFALPKAEYENNFEFKFFLDGITWMKGGNRVKQSFDGLDFTDQQVQFDAVSPRYPLPFDCLRVREDANQQTLVRNCYHEDYEFDVIVIGSGMGGGILADALTDREKGVETLVLDIGCLDFATHFYNLPGTDLGDIVNRHQVGDWVKADPKMAFSGGVQMNLGGRSVFWAGIIPRMQDWELKKWPTPVADYLRDVGYDKAEKLMRKHVTFGEYQNDLIQALRTEFKGEFDVQNTPRAYEQPEFVEQGEPPKSFIRQSVGTFSTAELLLDSLTNKGKGGSEHLYVNLNHMVTDVRCENNRVVEVICQDLVGNKRRTYRAKQFVLAAGSMESVRIALQSGLQLDHPLIGKGFTDHPAYFLGYDGNRIIYLNETSPWAGSQRHARIFFYPKKAYEGALFNVEIVINNDYWRERHTDNDIQEERLKSPRTAINFKFTFDVPLNESNYINLDDNQGNGRTRKLIARVDRVPENPAWRKTIEGLAGRLLKFFDGPDDLVFSDFGGWGADGTPHHAGGSLRMGVSSDPKKCVVDTDLKFLKIDNLYVCDVSVFPHIPAANPSLTLAALALRLADHLGAKVGK